MTDWYQFCQPGQSDPEIESLIVKPALFVYDEWRGWIFYMHHFMIIRRLRFIAVLLTSFFWLIVQPAIAVSAGSVIAAADPLAAQQSVAPVQLPATTARLAAGKLHSAMILYDGQVLVWGDNSFGQIGQPGLDYADSPQLLKLPARAVSISLGADHTLILTEDGLVYAMGRNVFGQLGDGTTASADTPVAVSGLPAIIAIAAGAYHSLALGKDGSVWAWGDNSLYQVGDVTSEAIKDPSDKVIGQRCLTPARIITGRATGIAAGGHFSVYLRDDGRLYAWGDNSRGQLGDGTTQIRARPTAVVGLTSVSQVAAGYQHVLAVRSEGQDSLYAWGDNSLGQLGISAVLSPDACLTLPTLINLTAPAQADDRIVALAAGYTQSAAVISQISGSGTESCERHLLYVWGNNAFGQLALGDEQSRSLPQPVGGWLNGYFGFSFLPLDDIAIGGFHLLVLSSKGLLAATGRGDRGQLGTVSIINRNVLTPVDIPDQIRPGWTDDSALSISRDSGQDILVRWPAAQDNLVVAGYRVRLRQTDGTDYTEDVGLTQSWLVTLARPQLACEVTVSAYDATGQTMDDSELSRLVGYLLPSGDPDDHPSDYFRDVMASVWLQAADSHRWQPNPDGILQPLEVPWDIEPIYGPAALQTPPDNRLLRLSIWLTVLLPLFLLIDGLIRRSQRRRQKALRHMP